MKISAKARYGLVSVVSMAENFEKNESTTVISLSEKLGISKIYLEQVFSLLKRGGIVNSTQGAKGGYHLSRPPKEITVYDLLSSIEHSIFEKTEETVRESDLYLENSIQEVVFSPIDHSLKNTLTDITIGDIVDKLEKYRGEGNYMYYL